VKQHVLALLQHVLALLHHARFGRWLKLLSVSFCLLTLQLQAALAFSRQAMRGITKQSLSALRV
jgi:hypothetical protein